MDITAEAFVMIVAITAGLALLLIVAPIIDLALGTKRHKDRMAWSRYRASLLLTNAGDHYRAERLKHRKDCPGRDGPIDFECDCQAQIDIDELKE